MANPYGALADSESGHSELVNIDEGERDDLLRRRDDEMEAMIAIYDTDADVSILGEERISSRALIKLRITAEPVSSAGPGSVCSEASSPLACVICITLGPTYPKAAPLSITLDAWPKALNSQNATSLKDALLGEAQRRKGHEVVAYLYDVARAFLNARAAEAVASRAAAAAKAAVPASLASAMQARLAESAEAAAKLAAAEAAAEAAEEETKRAAEAEAARRLEELRYIPQSTG